MRERVVHDDPQPVTKSRWVWIIFLILLAAEVICMLNNQPDCIDGCGPDHNTTSVADLDGDGDLDVVLNTSGTIPIPPSGLEAGLWINQGGGQRTPRKSDSGGPSTVAGDLDGDGDADLVQIPTDVPAPNQGGVQGGELGEFKPWRSIAPQENPQTGPRKDRSCSAI